MVECKPQFSDVAFGDKGESIRVFPLLNWTEKDIWQYIRREQIEIVPLYFARGLNKNLGFKEMDRVENIRRIAEVMKQIMLYLKG